MNEGAVLAEAQATLGQRSDVLGVRLGWVFRDGWITDERALVVTVAQKLTRAELAAAGRELLALQKSSQSQRCSPGCELVNLSEGVGTGMKQKQGKALW